MRIDSLILRTAVRLVLPLTLLFAVYAAIKGHNGPGGGFIAGLITAVGLCTYRMAFGQRAFFRLLPTHPRWLVFAGLSVAAGVAVIPLLRGRPRCTSAARGCTSSRRRRSTSACSSSWSAWRSG